MINLILASDRRMKTDVNSSIPSVSLDSDHRLVLGKFKVMKSQVTRERIVIEKLKEVSVDDRMREEIATLWEIMWNKIEVLMSNGRSSKNRLEVVPGRSRGLRKF